MINEKLESTKPKDGTHLLWKLLSGAALGAATIGSLKLGWQKSVAWARGMKPNYVLGDAPLYGALGGITSVALNCTRNANRERADLTFNDDRQNIPFGDLSLDKSFARQIADENLSVRSGINRTV